MTATINISNSAFFSLLQEGIEAYSFKFEHKEEITVEKHADLFGSANKRLPFKCNIEHISVSSTAERTRDSVTTYRKVLNLKKDIANMFGDDYRYLGTFHTHPWVPEEIGNAKTLREEELHNFSYGDYVSEVDKPCIQVGKNSFSVALVMTILSTKKADDRKDGIVDSNLFEFSLGNLKIWFRAQVYQYVDFEKLTQEELELLKNQYPSKDIENDIKDQLVPIPIDTQVDCDFLDNFGFHLEKFGRLSFDQSEPKYRTADEADQRWFSKI